MAWPGLAYLHCVLEAAAGVFYDMTSSAASFTACFDCCVNCYLTWGGLYDGDHGGTRLFDGVTERVDGFVDLTD